MVHTALTENASKKPTIFTSIQTNRHQSLKKFHDQLKKDSQFCHHLNIFFRSQPFTMKNAKKHRYNINKIQYQAPSYFPPNQKSKTFNKSTIKLSYFCMPNIRSKINSHDKKIVQPKPVEPQKLCNCLIKKEWIILNGSCSTSSILYQATIKCSDSKYKQKEVQRNLSNDIQETLCKPQKIIPLH